MKGLERDKLLCKSKYCLHLALAGRSSGGIPILGLSSQIPGWVNK